MTVLPKPKIVIGCPVANRDWCLPDWFDAIAEQDMPIEVVCVYSDSQDNTEDILRERGATIVHDERPGRPRNEIDGHCWGEPKTYAYMASLRNILLDSVLGADFFLSLDSDIILPKNGLEQLLFRLGTMPMGSVIAPAVNMTTNATAWNTMQWVDPSNPNLANRAVGEPPAGKVDVIMAAMLFDRKAITDCRWKGHDQGEDVGFSKYAAENNTPLWWTPEVKCRHLMHR